MILRALVSLLVCLSAVQADGMSVADLVNLKKAGFSEQEIQAEIAKSPPKLDQAGLAKLKSAGFSEAFLARLRAASGGLAIDTVRSMHKAGKSVPEILAALPRSGDRPALTTPQALELTRAGVPAIIVRALRGGALDANEILRRARSGASASELSALLDFVGTSGNATAEQAQALKNAGVPDSLIDRLRSTAGGSISRTSDGRSLYRHPADRFSLRYPSGWRLLLRPHKEKFLLEYVFTPDKTQTDPEKLSTGFSIVPVHLVAGSNLDIASLDDLVKLTIPSILTEEPGLKLHGKPRSGRIAGADARIIELRGSGRGAKALRISSIIVRREGVLCFVSAWAPVEEYDRYGADFNKCAASLRFGKPRSRIQRRATTSQEFVRRYRNSVVQVRSAGGSGTGFIVRKDGYVLTNHHVVYDEKKKAFTREFTLQFDASLNRRPLRAVLVAAKLQRLADAGRNLSAAGVDIALLRITDPGPFEALPITPLAAVRLSDPVVTMGFPKSTLLGGFERLSMFVTRGVVVRFNKDAAGRTRGLFIDAKITHGSSGGPCVDLASGGVIGLNTWGFDIGQKATNDLVGYNGVVPIDEALKAWPDILRLDADRARLLTPDDRMALAIDYYEQGLFEAAERQAAAVVKARPPATDARVLMAASVAALGKSKEQAQFLDAALAADPTHYSALINRARLHTTKREFAQAEALAKRAIQSRPGSPTPYLARGNLYYTVRRYANALADADKAAQLGQGLSSEPELLAGRSLYKLGKLKEGLARYQKALAITPGRFEAYMGIAEALELSKKYEDARTLYAKIAAQVPRSPAPVLAIARCCLGLNQTKQARDALVKAHAIYKKNGQRPPEGLYLQLAQIHQKLGETRPGVRAVFDRCREYPWSIYAHVNLAELHKSKYPGIAYGHALAAIRIAKGDKQVRAHVAAIQPVPLSVADIRVMEQLDYGTAGLVVVNYAQTSFRITPELVKSLSNITPYLARALSVVRARQEKGDKMIGTKKAG